MRELQLYRLRRTTYCPLELIQINIIVMINLDLIDWQRIVRVWFR